MAAEIDRARRKGFPQRTLIDLISDFRGLSSTIKQREIAEALDIGRVNLDTFFNKSSGTWNVPA